MQLWNSLWRDPESLTEMQTPNIPSLSSEQFESLMEEIDAELNIQMSDCRGRELRGWMLFCQKLKLEGMPLHHPLSDKVTKWFETRYGDRLKIDPCFGCSAILLRNDIVRVRCALFYGRAILFCAPETMHIESQLALNQPAYLNVLRQCQGLTQGYARALKPDEQSRLLDAYVESERAMACISDAPNEAYVHEARGDLSASVEQLFMRPPQFGSSKWSSLQAVEKFLKSFIVQKGSTHERIHVITELAKQAVNLGLRPIKSELIQVVQCTASVRYDSKLVSRGEAFDAHRAAVLLCAEVAGQFPAQASWTTTLIAPVKVRLGTGSETFPGFLLSRNKT
jgi:hypothetical protein